MTPSSYISRVPAQLFLLAAFSEYFHTPPLEYILSIHLSCCIYKQFIHTLSRASADISIIFALEAFIKDCEYHVFINITGEAQNPP